MGETNMDKLGTSKEYNYVLYLSIISIALLLIFTYMKEKEKKELSR
jgi:hypothetical protein